ncbi:MAG: hypothetical protein AAB428_02930 [Patescibacteria group bacterium]
MDTENKNINGPTPSENFLSPGVALLPNHPENTDGPATKSMVTNLFAEDPPEEKAASFDIGKRGKKSVVPKIPAEKSESVENSTAAETERAPTKENVGKLKALRTYQADVAESLRSNKTSIASMVMAEQNRKGKLAELDSPVSKKNIILITISAIFLLAGIVSVFLVFSKPGSPADSAKLPKNPSLVFVENEKQISATGINSEILAKTISAEVSGANNKLDSMENVYLSEDVDGNEIALTTQRLFFFLDNRMPPSLLRSLGKKFMLGIHNFNGNHPFLILQTNFYENAFAGMLVWEQYMARDIFPIFAIKISSDSPVFLRPFEDKTIKNRDGRVLKDDEGKVVLFYVFKDKKTIIITDSEYTLEEVSRRLNSSGSTIR